MTWINDPAQPMTYLCYQCGQWVAGAHTCFPHFSRVGGWVCPRCGRCYAPWVPQCTCKPDDGSTAAQWVFDATDTAGSAPLTSGYLTLGRDN